MLVQYTHLSELTAEQKIRLQNILRSNILEGRSFIQFEGMTLSVNEIKALQAPRSNSQILLG
jgi:hypothetical protein